MKNRIALTFACLTLAAFLAPAAQAQATRTWVSGVGDDANPCSRTAPCKTFQGTISKTAANGEINVLDPGGFGAVTITKSITISAQFEAGVLVSGTNGIIVNLPNDTDRVVLEGLDIEGLGTGVNGVLIIGKGKVTIRRCTIHHFTGNGVNLVGLANARVFIEKSFLSANDGGVNVTGNSGAANKAFVVDSTIDDNTSYGIQVTGPSALVLTGSMLSGSVMGILTPGGGQVISYGNNILRNPGLPTQTLSPQ